jgi:hypothetical protein
MEKDEMMSLRLSKGDKKLLEKDAKKEERSTGNLLLWCWKKWRESKKG